jgi:dienelactone hydrolase
MAHPCIEIKVCPDTSLYHVGPPLDLGPLPSFFYFSLSGPDSLSLDPFNQPVQFLHGKMIRVFSMTLPFHENNLPASQAIPSWAHDFAQNKDPIDHFLTSFDTALDFAIQERFINPDKIAVGGLSRGGFVALHAAAKQERLQYVLAFAPITKLSKLKEFSSLSNNPLIDAYDIERIGSKLGSRNIRFHIGNRDTLVDTRSCFDAAMKIVEHSEKRSPSVSFHLHPSIGHKGHGTPPEIFLAGADWIASCLTSS